MTTSLILIFVLCFVDVKIAMFGYVLSSNAFIKLLYLPDLHWIFIGSDKKYYNLLMEENNKMIERMKKKKK